MVARTLRARFNTVPDYLPDVATTLGGVSASVKAKTGKTIGTWLAEKTMLEAKSLLQSPALAIKEIAYRLGFAVPAHFSTYFKKYAHCSPGQYRRAHQAGESEEFVALGG